MVPERVQKLVDHLGVTIDDDPGADLRRATGRFFYFAADEIAAMEPDADGR